MFPFRGVNVRTTQRTFMFRKYWQRISLQMKLSDISFLVLQNWVLKNGGMMWIVMFPENRNLLGFQGYG